VAKVGSSGGTTSAPSRSSTPIWAAKESEALGTKVTYTYYEASKAPKALQLANQGKALPDVYFNVVGIPLAALVKDNSVHELNISQDILDKLPKGLNTEGVTNIDGKLYGLPLFSFRQYTAVTGSTPTISQRPGWTPTLPRPPTTNSAPPVRNSKTPGSLR
jgi:ABC-type glycerol-3-phosphate transport system substrate-binding protein